MTRSTRMTVQDISKPHYEYLIFHPSTCDIENVSSYDPLTPEQICELLGGDYEFISPLNFGPNSWTGCVLKNRGDLPFQEPKFLESISGPVLVGKLENGLFVGMIHSRGSVGPICDIRWIPRRDPK